MVFPNLHQQCMVFIEQRRIERKCGFEIAFHVAVGCIWRNPIVTF